MPRLSNHVLKSFSTGCVSYIFQALASKLTEENHTRIFAQKDELNQFYREQALSIARAEHLIRLFSLSLAEVS